MVDVAIHLRSSGGLWMILFLYRVVVLTTLVQIANDINAMRLFQALGPLP